MYNQIQYILSYYNSSTFSVLKYISKSSYLVKFSLNQTRSFKLGHKLRLHMDILFYFLKKLSFCEYSKQIHQFISIMTQRSVFSFYLKIPIKFSSDPNYISLKKFFNFMFRYQTYIIKLIAWLYYISQHIWTQFLCRIKTTVHIIPIH